MKAVILAGGFGTRISEETHLKPKPMIEIGGKPILWHILKIYSKHGINDFIICCGYRGYLIKEYFANYFLHMSDVTFDMKTNSMKVHQKNVEPWKITLVDTGEKTKTGGRLKRIREYIDKETFCFTYGDGVGDACDECPEVPTGNHSAPYSIYDIQETCSTNHPPEDTAVSISCAVTAIKTKYENNGQVDYQTFWCQDRQGGPHSGIYIFSRSDEGTVALGNDVSLQGTYEEYYGAAELVDVTITVTDTAGAIIDPLVLDPTNLVDPEQYEGMLVRVEDVTVTAENADSSGDYDEFAVTGDLRVDDFIWEDMDNNYAVGTTFTSITGILHYSYGNYKIVPRSADDLVTP